MAHLLHSPLPPNPRLLIRVEEAIRHFPISHLLPVLLWFFFKWLQITWRTFCYTPLGTLLGLRKFKNFPIRTVVEPMVRNQVGPAFKT